MQLFDLPPEIVSHILSSLVVDSIYNLHLVDKYQRDDQFEALLVIRLTCKLFNSRVNSILFASEIDGYLESRQFSHALRVCRMITRLRAETYSEQPYLRAVNVWVHRSKEIFDDEQDLFTTRSVASICAFRQNEHMWRYYVRDFPQSEHVVKLAKWQDMLLAGYLGRLDLVLRWHNEGTELVFPDAIFGYLPSAVALGGQYEVFAWLLEQNVQIFGFDIFKAGWISGCEQILSRAWRIYAPDNQHFQGITYHVQRLMQSRRIEEVQRLMQDLSSSESKTRVYAAALDGAIAAGHEDLVRTLLLDAGPVISGYSPRYAASYGFFSSACRVSSPDLVQTLLDARIVYMPTAQRTAGYMTYAAIRGSVPVIQMLLKGCPGDDRQPAFGPCFLGQGCPLIRACLNGHLDAAQCLIENGADVNFNEYYNGLANSLCAAVVSGNVDLVRFLLESGAPTDLEAAYGDNDSHIPDRWRAERAFILACALGHGEIVLLLLQYGAKMELLSKTGDTAVQVASDYDQRGIVRMLLRRGMAEPEDREPKLGRYSIMWRALTHPRSDSDVSMDKIRKGFSLVNHMLYRC